MIFYQFKDYEDFKSIFGFVKHGNGKKSRKNKILLAYLKTPEILREASTTWKLDMLNIRTMPALKKYIFDRLATNEDGLKYRVRIVNRTFWSNVYETDEKEGICEDGDSTMVRYLKHERDGQVKAYKMKPGKLLRNLISESAFGKKLCNQVITYLAEEISNEWNAYASTGLKLFVNQDFDRIYSPSHCKGNFDSCMMGKGYSDFYKDYVDASAAYLQDRDGKIVARCIIYNNVFDENGKTWRYAERQYSSDKDDTLKRALIDHLIKGNYIDCYKQIGAGCHECTAIVDLNGNSLSEKQFGIDCSAYEGDILSYQDSFIFLNLKKGMAYNYEPPCGYDYELSNPYGGVGYTEDDEYNPDEDDE
ncbi:MAG: hypothetical protein LIO94_06510 [Clostridiales bacterium]|nr:hypothetical protein [Clostridiales bacterium]MCC8115204.1 hypothetical protein [Bacteroidales bacterium]